MFCRTSHWGTVDDIMLSTPSEQEIAGILDAMVRHIHTRRRDLSPTKIQEPATLVKILNLLDICIENNLTWPKESLTLTLGCWEVISCPWNIASDRSVLFCLAFGQPYKNKWFEVGTLGHVISVWSLEDLETEINHKGDNHAYVMEPPQKSFQHQGLSKLPSLAVLHEYHYNSRLGSHAVRLPGERINWSSVFGTSLDSALGISSLGWS